MYVCPSNTYLNIRFNVLIANWLSEKVLFPFHTSFSLLFNCIYCPFHLTLETIFGQRKEKYCFYQSLDCVCLKSSILRLKVTTEQL